MRSLLEVRDFGGTAAEDDDIKTFFVRTPAFDELANGKKHVVVGRKGSGKTALYLALLDRDDEADTRVVGLTFRQYPWATHYKYESTDVDSTERFVTSWTFLILVEALSAILKNRPAALSSDQRSSLDEVETFLKKNYGSVNLDFKKAFPSGGLKLDGFDLAPAVLGNQIGGIRAARQDASGLGNTLVRVCDWLSAHLERLGSACPHVLILFDELDLGFDPSNAQYVDRVVGLLLASRLFTIRFSRKGVNVHPIIFLRSDIFDGLHFGDKNKIVNSETIELLWHDRLSYDGASLKHLIDWRVNEVMEIGDIDSAWSAAFDETLARGTQHKFQHITFRTFLRPRDVIQFCNVALAEAKRRSPTDPHVQISNLDLKNCRMDYSRYLVRELDDEIAEAHPKWQTYLEVLRAVGHAKFTVGEFEQGYVIANAKTALDKTPEEIMELFYDFSIIGFEKKAASGSGLTHHFKYQDESVLFERTARSYLVHRGLKEFLGITETGSQDE